MMNKKALLASVLAASLALSSCSLIVKDPAVDAATEILTVGSHVHTKGEVTAQVDSYIQSMQNYYASYGYNIDPKNADVIKDAQEAVISILTQQDVLADKLAEMNIELTEEDKANAASTYELYASIVGNSVDMEEGEARDAAIAQLVESTFGITKEDLENNLLTEKLEDACTTDVTVSDEAVATEYDSRVASAKETYDATPAAYGTAVTNGTTVYYRPAGYRNIQSILVKFSDEDSAAISAMNTKKNTQTNAVSNALTAINDLGADFTAFNIPEDNAATPAAYLATLVEVTLTENGDNLDATTVDTLPEGMTDELKAAVTDYAIALKKEAWYTDAAAAAVKTAFANVDEKADAVQARIDAGEDWQALQYELTEDPGMQEGAANAATGYAICAQSAVNQGGNMDSAYVEAAMALANVGDTSAKVASESFGYFFVHYASEVVEGNVEMTAETAESIKEELLHTAKEEAFSTLLQSWIDGCGAKSNLDALK